MTHEQREIHRKKRVLEHAERMGNVNKTCRYFGVARSTFYLWRARYRELGDEGLKSRRCCAHNHPNKTPDGVVDKILHLRRTYHMGPMRIVWYLERYLDIRTSDATVYRVCKRHGLNRLPNRVGRRAVHTHRYEKQVPGHHTSDYIALVDVDPSLEHLAYVRQNEVFVSPIAGLGSDPPRSVGFHEAARIAFFHPTEPIVVSGASELGEFRFWSYHDDSGVPVRSLDFEPFSYRPEFDPTGRFLAAGGGDGRAWIWDLEAPPDAQPVVLERPDPDRVMGTTFHPYESWLVTTDQQAAAFWTLATPWPFELRGHKDRLDALVFDLEGQWLVSSAPLEEVVMFWPLEGSQGGRKLDFSGGRSVAVDPAGDRLALVHDGAHVLVYSLNEGETANLGDEGEIANLGEGDFWEVAFSNGGRYAAASGGQFVAEDTHVTVWDLETGEEILLDAGDGAFVIDVIFLSDNRVVGSGDGGVRIWNLETRDSVVLMEGPTGYLDVTPDDKQLVILTGENTAMRHGGTVVVHDLESGEIRELTTHGAKVNALAVDLTGTKVATGDTFGIVRFGNISGEEPHLLLGHSARVESVAFDPKGRWIASGDSDGRLLLWPVPEGEPYHTLPLTEFLSRLKSLTNYRVVADAEAPDGYRLEVGPFEGWQEVPVW